MIPSTESHIPCEVACSTCGAGPDRRCGDAYGEFEAGVYCPGRQQDLMAALILDAETLAEITEQEAGMTQTPGTDGDCESREQLALRCARATRARDAAWAEYTRVRDAARTEYTRVRDAAWAEYARVAWAEYERVPDLTRPAAQAPADPDRN